VSLFVRTGNNGTDPDFQINDLLGIIITSGPSWNELTSSNASNPTGGAGEFTSVELYV